MFIIGFKMIVFVLFLVFFNVIFVVILYVILEELILWYELNFNVVLILIIGKFVRILLFKVFFKFFCMDGIYFFGIILLIILLMNLNFLFGFGLKLIIMCLYCL